MLQAGPVVAVPRHKQALKELLSDEQAHTHKPEPGSLVNKAKMMIAAPSRSKKALQTQRPLHI